MVDEKERRKKREDDSVRVGRPERKELRAQFLGPDTQLTIRQQHLQGDLLRPRRQQQPYNLQHQQRLHDDLRVRERRGHAEVTGRVRLIRSRTTNRPLKGKNQILA